MKNGIILLDKEVGCTSREVDNEIGRLLATRHIGHLGTLDPFASGLLILGVNKGTKFLPYLDDSKKSYIANLRLGIASSTGDPTGDLAPEVAIPELSLETIKGVLTGFLGESSQMPPMTSAIKVNGEALYKKAHRHEEVERKPRQIHIDSLNLISYKDHNLVFSCTVSRGTYIRTLGEDIAKKLGTVGYLTSLRRLSIASIMVDKAKKIASLTEDDILDPTIFITTMKHVEIDDKEKKKVCDGVPMDLAMDYGEKVLLVLHGEPLAVYKRYQDNHYLSERGLF